MQSTNRLHLSDVLLAVIICLGAVALFVALCCCFRIRRNLFSRKRSDGQYLRSGSDSPEVANEGTPTAPVAAHPELEYGQPVPAHVLRTGEHSWSCLSAKSFRSAASRGASSPLYDEAGDVSMAHVYRQHNNPKLSTRQFVQLLLGQSASLARTSGNGSEFWGTSEPLAADAQGGSSHLEIYPYPEAARHSLADATPSSSGDLVRAPASSCPVSPACRASKIVPEQPSSVREGRRNAAQDRPFAALHSHPPLVPVLVSREFTEEQFQDGISPAMRGLCSGRRFMPPASLPLTAADGVSGALRADSAEARFSLGGVSLELSLCMPPQQGRVHQRSRSAHDGVLAALTPTGDPERSASEASKLDARKLPAGRATDGGVQREPPLPTGRPPLSVPGERCSPSTSTRADAGRAVFGNDHVALDRCTSSLSACSDCYATGARATADTASASVLDTPSGMWCSREYLANPLFDRSSYSPPPPA